MKALESLQCFKPAPSRFLINNWHLPYHGSLAFKGILAISGW